MIAFSSCKCEAAGLCLSRSFGDAVAATIGCTSKPEVLHRKLQPHLDSFLILATDGIWDVLNNEQVILGKGACAMRTAGLWCAAAFNRASKSLCTSTVYLSILAHSQRLGSLVLSQQESVLFSGHLHVS